MGSFPLTENGFGEVLDNSQVGYSSELFKYSTDAGTNYEPDFSGPMWTEVSAGMSSVTNIGTNEYGLVFDDVFSGIINVDDTIDSDSDFRAVTDLSEETVV